VSALAPEGVPDLQGQGGKKNPRSGRLLRHADFERVYKQGRRHFSTNITVFYLRRAEGEGMRVGFTVGRALGGAVDRNRMKRRLREAVRLSRRSPGPGVDVVINPKKSVRTVEFSVLLAEVSRAFEVIRQRMADEPRAT
jgi:ribonuclease P protein component